MAKTAPKIAPDLRGKAGPCARFVIHIPPSALLRSFCRQDHANLDLKSAKPLEPSSFPPASRCIAREADGQDQACALKNRFDEKAAAKLLKPCDANRQDKDGHNRTKDVDATGVDRGAAEQRSNESRQQELRPDDALPDAKPRRQDHSGESDDRAPDNEGADHQTARRDPGEFGRFPIAADRIDLAADRKVFEAYPQNNHKNCYKQRGQRYAEKGKIVNVGKLNRKIANQLRSIRIPRAEAVQYSADTESGDERVNLGIFDQQPVDQPNQSARTDDNEHHDWPRDSKLDQKTHSDNVHKAQAIRNR